ncbi:hypothetical protein MKW98_023375 [Papaver atlanticum]|uniref:Uncharacterized protein n=1 Tax=Papaver atlanticum TaxID=357466 RepID=A0AAD4SYN4_9MAGN|nr:hypothetical protein MKW98_023375 [Papaver atlanticum]
MLFSLINFVVVLVNDRFVDKLTSVSAKECLRTGDGSSWKSAQIHEGSYHIEYGKLPSSLCHANYIRSEAF